MKFGLKGDFGGTVWESAIPTVLFWESFPQNMRFLGPFLDHDDGNGGVDDDDDV